MKVYISVDIEGTPMRLAGTQQRRADWTMSATVWR